MWLLHASENFPVFYHSRSFILSVCGCCMRKGSYRNSKHKYVIHGQMFDSLCDFWVFVLFFYGTLSKNDHAVSTCWPDQTKPQNPVLFHMELCCGPCYCSNSEWGYRGFLWIKGTPKYISKIYFEKPPELYCICSGYVTQVSDLWASCYPMHLNEPHAYIWIGE